MSQTAPPLDPRSAEDIRRQLEALLNTYLKGIGGPVQTAAGNGAVAALAGVFARYSELIIERLNQVPDKNRLAFFDLIGASLAPPQAARVPLTFLLAPGATEATVPARAPVAAPAGPGRDKPVLFETERELAVTTARLTRLISWDAVADQIGDYCDTLGTGSSSYQLLFAGTQPIERYFYFGAALFFLPWFSTSVSISAVPGVPVRAIDWQIWDGQKGVVMPTIDRRVVGSPYVSDDGSKSLTQQGVLQLFDLAAIPLSKVNGISSRWLRGKLIAKLTPDTLPAQLPVLTSFGAGISGSSPEFLLDAAFLDQTPLDTTKDFYPFGNRPAPGATWYLASREVFSKVGQWINIIAPPSDTSGFPKANSQNVQLGWEYWTGAAWTRIVGDSGVFLDSSSGLSQGNGASFILTQAPQLTRVNGIENYWVRVRFLSGAYSQATDATAVAALTSANAAVVTAQAAYSKAASDVGMGLQGAPAALYIANANFDLARTTATAAAAAAAASTNIVPPSLAKASVSYRGGTPGQTRLDALARFDGMNYQVIDPSRILPDSASGLNQPQSVLDASRFAPFAQAEDTGRSLYFGFELPATTLEFPKRAVSLYFDLAAPGYGDPVNNNQARTPPQLVWSYWSTQGWQRLLVRDETGSLNYSGLIEFLPPTDFGTREMFSRSACYWLRLGWTGGDYRYLPRLRRVLQNATMAVQASTVSGEILGSSNGAAGQTFTAARKPVLIGAQLEVREPALPSAAERDALSSDEGEDAITPVAGGGAWVRWHEVGDFHGSGPRDRHFVLDHLSGEVRFGDGSSGLIPSRGAGNIRLASYASGGGDGGNTEAGAITQLKTTVPSIASVSNPLAAGGGVGAETVDALLDRAPRGIRHGARAVTCEDFEDLARLASTEVARCRCVPLLDLRDPAPMPKAGQLTLIIVPVSQALRPTPSVGLIERVRQFLDARRLPGIDLFVLGAEYVSVDVTTEVGLKDLSAAREVELAVRAALEGFLHPLTGGFDGRGWDFGRHPHRSDIFALLEAIDGVDYVRTLVVNEITDPKDPGANKTDRFLVCSGNHSISLYFGA